MSENHLIVSDPCIVMPQSSDSTPLGNILQEADLISASQVEVALNDQNSYQELRIGEILALRGWLKQQTADFFAQHWSELIQRKRQLPIGYYLKAAGLLNEEQINLLLAEQEQIGLRFGALAVLKGWIKPATLEFFLKHLYPERRSESPFTFVKDGDDFIASEGERAAQTSIEDTLTDEAEGKDTWTDGILNKDTLIDAFEDANVLDKDTIIEEEFEDFFNEDEIISEDIPTQHSLPAPVNIVPADSDPSELFT
jgi:hypothetical protein